MSAEHVKSLEIEEPEDDHLIFNDDEGGAVHEDTEGVWLISYADLMTLLMGFFALMLSMANFDESTFTSVGEAAAEYMGGEVEQPYEDIGSSIKELITEKGLDEKVSVDVKKSGITIMFEGTLLFNSGSYSLKSDANDLMKELIQVLDQKAGAKKFVIEGHTDDIPISKGVIASNWELSSLRANSVARLFETFKFSKEQILTLGFGETRPLVPHRDKENNAIVSNQEKNRRVVIKVVNEHPI